MNKILIEKEIQRRVAFKMGEFWTSFENHMKRNEHYKWAAMNREDSQKAQHFIEAYEEIRDILRKEIELPTALDDETEKRIWESKEFLVDKISNRLLERGTRDYIHKKSFINNCIVDFIND
jgi:hypothetical protein